MVSYRPALSHHGALLPFRPAMKLRVTFQTTRNSQFLTVIHAKLALQLERSHMLCLEIRQQGYITIGMSFILLITGETHIMSRDACEHKLNGYVQACSWKPRYYGYPTYNEADVAWAFYLETQIVPLSPADGGVLATPVPLAQPTTPQRNHNHNRFPNVQSTTFPRSPYNSSAHHGSPSPARVTSSPARASGHITSTPRPLYSQSPPPSQPYSVTAAQQVEPEETSFFIVIIGYSPGVYVSL
jgi:hypothetical protein